MVLRCDAADSRSSKVTSASSRTFRFAFGAACKSNRRREAGSYILNWGKSQLQVLGRVMGKYWPRLALAAVPGVLGEIRTLPRCRPVSVAMHGVVPAHTGNGRVEPLSRLDSSDRFDTLPSRRNTSPEANGPHCDRGQIVLRCGLVFGLPRGAYLGEWRNTLDESVRLTADEADELACEVCLGQ